MEATRDGLASLRAINQFENRLLLSGVGAVHGYDFATSEHYPTPGMFDVDAELKRQLRASWFCAHGARAHRVAGWVWGYGETDNRAFAMQHIDKKMRSIDRRRTVHINLSGYSRGGAAAIHLANMSYKKYGQQIQFNLFLIDPNPGPGRHHHQQKKNIPPNVSRLIFAFNRDESIWLFRSRGLSHYRLNQTKTAVSALYLSGNHLEQEQLPLRREPGEKVVCLSPSEINQYFLELFFESYGAIRIEQTPKKMLIFEKNERIKKGFVSDKCQLTALDRMINQLDALKESPELPLSVEQKERVFKSKHEKQKARPSVILYGGSFAPLHWGHLRTALRVQEHLRVDHFFFLPCKAPVLDKTLAVSAADRVAMLKGTLEAYPDFSIDLHEIERDTPSFMIDTLRASRQKWGVDAPIILLLGMDSFLQLPRWHQWETLLLHSHLLVMDRAGIPPVFSNILQTLLDKHQTRNKNDLFATPYGKIYRFDAGQYDISSTAVREAMGQKQNTEQLLPMFVRRYIDAHKLFI